MTEICGESLPVDKSAGIEGVVCFKTPNHKEEFSDLVHKGLDTASNIYRWEDESDER